MNQCSACRSWKWFTLVVRFSVVRFKYQGLFLCSLEQSLPLPQNKISLVGVSSSLGETFAQKLRFPCRCARTGLQSHERGCQCFEMQPSVVLLRPKRTSAVLVVKRRSKWFAGLRPVLEALQHVCALYCNTEIPSEKATAFPGCLLQANSSQQLLHGMHEKLFGGYSELQTHCLFLVLFFFFFSLLCTESVTFFCVVCHRPRLTDT